MRTMKLSEPFDRLIVWTVQNPLFRVGLWVLMLLLGVRFLLFIADLAVHPTHGFIAYYTAARLVREHADASQFYDDAWFKAQSDRFKAAVDDIYNVNPPTTALMLFPFTYLDYTNARVGWTFLNLIWLITVVGWLLHKLELRGLWVPAFVAFVLMYQPLLANFALGQAYVLMLALLVIAWQGYREQLDGVLGVVLGLTLVLKTAGILLWVLLLVERRWRALAWSLVTVSLVVIGSLPWLGIRVWRTYFHFLSDLNAQPSLSVTAYQTQLGFFRHLLIFDEQWNPSPLFRAPELGAWLPWFVLLFIITVSIRQAMITDHSDLSFAVFVIANVILSPVSLDYHYTLLILPIVILVDSARKWPTIWSKIGMMLALAFITLDLPYRSPRLASGGWALIAYPKLYGAWLLWGLALIDRFKS